MDVQDPVVDVAVEEKIKKSKDLVFVCVDTSGSTQGCHDYYKRVHCIIHKSYQSYKNVKIVSWNSGAKFCEKKNLSAVSASGGTSPSAFLKLIAGAKKTVKYHLVVTTDGQIGSSEMEVCRKILFNSNILSKVLSFRMYFIGEVNQMNLRISDIFSNIKDKRIIINDQEPIQIMNIDVSKLTYDDLVNNNNIVASVLEIIKNRPEEREELRVQFCRLNTQILAEIAKDNAIKEYYLKDDVEGCVKFVKKIDPANKTKFQQVMSKLIEICSDKNKNLYSLSHLVISKTVPDTSIPVEVDTDTEDEDDLNDVQENEDNITCDITLIKSSNPCAEIVMLGDQEDKILSDEQSKLISQNPWLILNDESIINKIVKPIGHYTYDLIAKNRMEEACSHYLSAFTRQKIYGVFVFHRDNSDIDYKLVFRNNNRAISFIFNKDFKLPGNKCVWNVIFLYILGNYHPHWKQYSKIIHEEIINILPRLNTFITLSPLLNPPIMDSLDAALWYIMKVSHRAFPNSVNNILRNVEEAERLIDIYEFIYPDCDISVIKFRVKVWNVWKYLVRNRTSNRLRLEVISQYQNHEIIDGNIILLSGNSRNQSIDLIPLHTRNLFNFMLTKPKATLFEPIPFENLDKGEVKSVEGVDDSVSEVEHIKICETTCRPLYMCPVSKISWKDCTGKYDVKKESFFNGFVRFCEKHKRYPENADEFLVHHSNKYNKFASKTGNYIVYGANIKDCFQAVIEKYSTLMKKYSAKDFVRTYNNNCDVKARVKNEENCSCDAH